MSEKFYHSHQRETEFYCNKFDFNSFKIFKEDMAAVTISKKLITWNEPTYLGAAVLDVSKLQLYQFHYKKIVPRYQDKARLLYKDNDSLFYEFETNDIYVDLQNLKEHLDFSTYPKNDFFFNDVKKKFP